MNSRFKKRNPGINTIKDLFLFNTGIKSLEDANGWYKKFYADAYTIKDMDKAVELVKAYKDKYILIVGDYDVDGQTSTSILLTTLQEEGYNVSYRIPNHFSEGFGINQVIIDEIDTSPEDTLIITCDNGIAQLEPIEYAKNIGYSVIVLDHHEPVIENEQIILPVADVVIDPVAKPDQCSFDGYCGAGLAYKFARALLNGANEELLAKMLSLAAIGTIADIMRLVEENYAIVRIALSRMTQTQFCTTGLYALLNVVKLTGKVTSKDIGFSIAPYLNSLTRMHDDGANLGVKLLTFNKDYEYQEALKLAEYCKSENDKRKELQNELQKQAIDIVDEKYSKDVPIVLYLKDVKEGLLGPIANKLADKYKVPVFVLTNSLYDGILKGSSRSYKYSNYNIKEELDKVSTCLYRYGGHSGAAGLSLEEKNFELFRTMLQNNAKDYVVDESVYYDLELSVEEVADAIAEKEKYGPYGEGNPEPVFLLKNFSSIKDARKGQFITFMGKTGKSVKIFGNGVNAVNFFDADKVGQIIRENPEVATEPTGFNIIGTISNNEFNGQITHQIEFTYLSKKDA